MGSKKKILMAVGLTAFFLFVGTVGYVKLERFSLLDAFYMTVITISTVGFGEINQLTGVGRIFTIFLILSGVGSVAFAAHAFMESLLERASNPHSKRKAMKKKIKNLKNHSIICGHGRVGAAAANHFNTMGADFVVIEASETESSMLEQQGYHHIFGDATREQTLLDAGIKRAGALLALLDSDPENLFTVLTARELNPTLHIIARTDVASSESRILRAGADSVISPFTSAGRQVADEIIAITGVKAAPESKKIDEEFTEKWVAIDGNSPLASQEVGAARSFVGGTIIGVRRQGVDYILPPSDMKLQADDMLLVAGDGFEQVEISSAKEYRKIVLIDDNPVIRRLYTRLFQKAGYHIQTAATGEEGLAIISEELPHAAVIDYKLPDISGLEICRRIRQDSGLDTVRLFLFTADDQEETRKKAGEVGVEMVVLKSPEAMEIISTVKKALE